MESKIEIFKADSFDDMNLKENLLRGIYSYGFEKPSPIQSKAIMPTISGKDIIAQAQSGTGKTGTFVISSLQRINENEGGCQIIIIAHTHELARQIHNVCNNIGQYVKMKPILCVGGTKIHECKLSLRSEYASIVIGTPGRIIDMIERRFLQVGFVKTLIIDEADEMLSKSFQNQIRRIIREIPKTTQICLFSATMPQEVLDLTRNFLHKPLRILVKADQLTLEGIRQFYINVDKEDWKFDTFCDIYSKISVNQSIVYVNTKYKANWLKDKLKEQNFVVSVIHSKMQSTERTNIMKEFRNGETRILISTDLTSRGIDVQHVSVVINYDIPSNKETYLHRIGRSGRFGKKGVAINFVTYDDYRKMEALESYYSTKIHPMPNKIEDFLV